MYNSESISQVYGVIIEYLDQLPEEERKCLKDLIYDDNCHMAKFALKNAKVNPNELTNFLANDVRKTIDKFHFINHIDEWCIQHCDPNKIDDLIGVNTEICEQLFRKVNSHSNCKSMNEPRYFLFWLYILDLHNLDIEGMVTASDPRSDYRWSRITVESPDISVINPQSLKVNIDDVSKEFNCLNIKDAAAFHCVDCGAVYKSEGYLESHRVKKHGDIFKPFACGECQKILKSKRNLEDHIIKMHRTCKMCKLEFVDAASLSVHMKEHTTCAVCHVDLKTKYKFERHMKSHL